MENSVHAIERKFALDTNCIVALEDSRPEAVHVKTLIAASEDQKIELAVVAVSASENSKASSSTRSYGDFEARLSGVGLVGAKQLYPLAIWDVFYWDHALWSTTEMEKLAADLKEVLFPKVQFVPDAESETRSRWRNQLCDVLVAWCCIYHRWDYLVTSDRNFHNHRRELAQFGLRGIVTPIQACELLNADLS
jgi:hypothetical protein